MTETGFHLKRRLTSFQIMILGFAGVILLGALVLMLPIAAASRTWTPFHEALFTSTSAVCVTGLVVQDTGSYWSGFGQTVILLLIQIGGISDPLVNIVIMLLIIVGGIGFLTWDDVCTHRLHLRRYRMQSKVILSATALLIVLPAILFFLTDFAALPTGERVLASLFQAVTPRTAGYNTADLTKMGDTSQAVTILLMLTGGAPGSTAGGMKVTTLAVLAANAAAVFHRREEPQLFGRRLENSAVKNAAAILLLYLGLTFAGAAITVG